MDKVYQIVIINKQYLQTYSPPSKSAIFFKTYTFKFRNLYGVFGACVQWRTNVNLQKIFVSGQNISTEVYGNAVGTFTPSDLCPFMRISLAIRNLEEWSPLTLISSPSTRKGPTWTLESVIKYRNISILKWPDFSASSFKGTHFLFLFAFIAAGVVQCGSRKTSSRTSTIVQIIFYFWSFEISVNILKNQK